jgi:hypothetical protein
MVKHWNISERIQIGRPVFALDTVASTDEDSNSPELPEELNVYSCCGCSLGKAITQCLPGSTLSRMTCAAYSRNSFVHEYG